MDDAELESIIDELETAAERAAQTIARVPPGRWADPIHTGDGAWTRHQLLCHLAANDTRQLVRIRIGAGMAEPGDAAAHEAELDTASWNRERVAERAGHPPAALLDEMLANRGALIDLLRSLSTAQRARPIPYRGVPTPIAEAVPTLIGHYDAHLDELVSGL